MLSTLMTMLLITGTGFFSTEKKNETASPPATKGENSLFGDAFDLLIKHRLLIRMGHHYKLSLSAEDLLKTMKSIDNATYQFEPTMFSDKFSPQNDIKPNPHQLLM
jgi:hypothetical protein